MPKRVERDIYASVRKAHPNYSEKRAKTETYSTMNKLGLLHNRAGGPEKILSSRRDFLVALGVVLVILIVAHFASLQAGVGIPIIGGAISTAVGQDQFEFKANYSGGQFK